MSHQIRAVLSALAGIALLATAALAVPAGAAPAAYPSGSAGTAQATADNAVSDSFSDTYADPSVIRGKDGYWYTYATSDPLRVGGKHGLMHMARTRDWSRWDYLGTVFTEETRPRWAEPYAGLWAPEIRYVAGRYLLYYTVSDTILKPGGGDFAIGVATAPTPSGPWTAGDDPVVAPRAAPHGGWWWTIDPAGFTDVDGQQYLYFGSYFGGLWATRMSPDGLRATGEPVQVAIDNRYEGSFVVRRDGWYYLMTSVANCCAGPTTGYSVFAGRSRSPLGPFVDAEGTSLMASRVGGTTVLTQNGNRFVGVGHHAVVTDGEGADFIVYHGIDRGKPWLNEPFGINRRPMLVDRLDWVDGWPRTRAGAGPSDAPQPAPSLGSSLGITPEDPAAGGFAGMAAGPADALGGATGVVRGAARTRADAPAGAVHLRLDVRAGSALRVQVGREPTVTVALEPSQGRLRVAADHDGATASDVAAVRPGSGWQTLTVEVTAGQVVAQLSDSDLADPSAEVRIAAPWLSLGAAPVRLTSGHAVVDNIVVNEPAIDAEALVPVPQPGALLTSEEFDDASLEGMTWVRQNPAATVAGGQLRWPVEGTDLVGGGNNAGLLLHEAPGDGDWIAEAKTHLDLGTDTVRNYQQVGMIAYASDDDFARLGKVAIWNTRQTEFGRELVATSDGRTSYGGAVVGTAAPTLWMRLAHHRNAAGEHLYRAGTSRDGVTWTWGAVWALEAGSDPRIGLYAHGGSQPAAVATFDYLRFFGSDWPVDEAAQ
jgi:arabinan endo-1,5-alpha-L-arabinosidase